MGKALQFICNTCKNEERLYLGRGMIYLCDKNNNEQERVTFICPECGLWKTSIIRIDNHNKHKCKNCKKDMIKFTHKDIRNEYKINLSKYPFLTKLKCTECNGRLELQEYFILWD